MCAPHRVDIICKWANFRQRTSKVLALQETLSSEENLRRALQRIMPGGQPVLDYSPNQTADSILLIHKTLKIVEQGCSGRGFASWAKIRTSVGVVGIVGIHASRKRSERPEVWIWLRRLINEGRWIVIGDFNMVEHRSDTIGPSPLLRGEELRRWTVCRNQADLTDTWFSAHEAKGPWFTRQALHGNRFDQAHLDRCYLSERGEWAYAVFEEDHQGRRSLSDHIPIRVKIQLSARYRREEKVVSYFKMNAKMLTSDGGMAEVKEEWQKHPTWAKDPRKKWGLALGRVRKTTDNATNRTEFEAALLLLRNRERSDAYITRIRCRIRWLQEGDAPTAFFFARYRAKMAQEKITALQLESGAIITEERDIFGAVHTAFSELYQAEEEDTLILAERREMLQLIDKRLTHQQNRAFRELPSTELIEEVIRSLPTEKAPGLDGVTAEVLVECWEFLHADCYAMVQSVWIKGRLLTKDNKGVIKLIPKGGDRLLLKSWRPITLLTTTYKIVAKIMAMRLKHMLPGIIDLQQTGFVTGRSIVDNVMSLRLAQEWAGVTRQDSIFVKLDFQKAYDRVSHSYLWDTLAALGMDVDSVLLIQGLVTNASALIHFNGGFSEEFPVGRGVRQGCPFGTLAFCDVHPTSHADDEGRGAGWKGIGTQHWWRKIPDAPAIC
ncbi:hypothetical protein R1sor_023504 [Riccia sorocarpa]|uniref:Reverse transcriptase domain-containing protein n=1 Tax=Riccia sorocarpa TaxID=122646 RepID=A0ABD3GMY4_9MARC